MQRSRILSTWFIVVALCTGESYADEPTAQPPRQERFTISLPFLRLARPPAPLRLTTEARLGGASSGVDLDGDRAYQLRGGSLLVWDLAIVDAARVIGRLDLLRRDWPGTVSVSDGIAVVLQQGDCHPVPTDSTAMDEQQCVRLTIVDAADSHEPRQLSWFPISGQRAVMSRFGRWLYIAAIHDQQGEASRSELLTYDLQRPGVPVLTSRLTDLPEFKALAAGEDRLAAAKSVDERVDIIVFDCDNGRLQHDQTTVIGAYRGNLFVVGERLWVMAWNGELWSWRWRSGTRFDKPLHGNVGFESTIIDQAVDLDGQLCLFDTYYESVRTIVPGKLNRLSCFDVGDPTAPTPTTIMMVEANEPLLHPATYDGRLLLSASKRGSMVLVDLTRIDGQRIVELDSGDGGGISAIARQGTNLYSWSHLGRLRRWDLSLPIGQGSTSHDGLPAEAGSIISTDLSGQGPAGRWLLHGNYVWDPFYPRIVFTAVDLANPVEPRSGPSRDWDPEVSNCLAWRYTASGDLVWMQGGMCPGNSTASVRTQRVNDSGFSWIQIPDLDAMSDQILWLHSRPLVLSHGAPDGDSLTVVDQDYRTVLAKLDGLGRVRTAAVLGTRVFVAGGEDGPRARAWLRILDLDDPRQPRMLDPIDLPLDEATQLFASDTRLLVCGWSAGAAEPSVGPQPSLCALDIRRPESPVLEGCTDSAPPPSGPTQWAFDPGGQFLYIADNGLTVLHLNLTGASLDTKAQPDSPSRTNQTLAVRPQ